MSGAPTHGAGFSGNLAGYGLYLGLHAVAQWRGPRANYLLLGGLLAALVTYFIPTSAHRFG